MTSFAPRKLDLDDRFAFGRHKGKLVEDVLNDDPAWLLWAIENEVIEVDAALQDAITEAARK